MSFRVLITGSSSGMGEEIAKVYSLRNKTNEEMVLILCSSSDRIKKTALACENASPGRSVRTVPVKADLSTLEGVNRLVDACSRACGTHPLDRVILNHGVLSFIPRGAKDAEEVKAYLRNVNYESYKQITKSLSERGMMDGSVTRMGITSSASVFTRAAYDHRLLGIHEYVRSKWDLTEWFLTEDIPALSKTVCYPLGNLTPMTTGANVLARNDPPRRGVTDERWFQGAPIDPPTSWWVSSVITAPAETTMKNHFKAIEKGERRSYTFQTIDEVLYRWVCSSVPGVNSWYLTYAPLLFGCSGNVSSILGLVIGQPLLILQILPLTGWPLLLLLHFLPGGTSSHEKRAVWEAPLRPVRSVVFTYAFVELYLIMLRLFHVQFTLTGYLIGWIGWV